MKINKLISYLIFIFGLILLISPFVSKLISISNQTTAISHYDKIIEGMSNEDIENSQKRASEFNNNLYKNNAFSPSLTEETISTINFAGLDVLAYISIPKINLELPIYEGSSNSVLSLGIGHLSNTSLPTRRS